MGVSQLTSNEQKTTELVKEYFSADFKPFAVFDEPLDCIRVVFRDCSSKDVRISDRLTVLEANYPKVPGRSEIVGVTIKGVAHLCETCGIPSDAPWQLAVFLDALVKSAPRDRVVVKHLVEPLVDENQITDVEKAA